MRNFTLDLTNENVTLTAYLPDKSREMPHMEKRKAILVLPGGAYKFCSDREAEPIAFKFMGKGYAAFILRYSLNENAQFPKPLDDAVDLVIYAFTHGENGDLFVQKAPAATLDVLAEALKQTYAKIDPKYGETEVKIIGTRHGEKLYETLVTREEMAKAIDMGGYYRIPCDNRDLNYDKFFTEGNQDMEKIDEYHSHNTARLDVEGMKQLLLKLNFIREDLGLQARAKARDYRSE